MSAISNAALNNVVDDLTELYMRAIGTEASDYGLGAVGGAWGALGVLTELKSNLLGAADLEPIVEIGDAVLRLETAFLPPKIVAGLLQNVLTAIQAHLSGVGLSSVSSINSYLSYYNTGVGGTWQLLAPKDFRDLHDAWSPSACLDPWNVYFEVLQGATYASALGRFVGSGAGAGTFTAGFDTMDTTKYCGGFGKLNVSGLAGTGNVTVTGTAFDPVTKNALTGRTWITSVTGNGLTTMTPGAGTAPANSLLCKVDNITVAAGITAGTMYAEAHRPTGRPALP